MSANLWSNDPRPARRSWNAWWWCALLLMALSPQRAGAETVTDLDAPSAQASSPTYRRLVTAVFAAAVENDSGELVSVSEKTLRRPGVKERTVLPAGVRLQGFEVLRVRADGRSYLVLRWDAVGDTGAPDDGAAVLASFIEGEAEPQDVMDVKTDMLNGFSSRPMVQLGESEGFFVENHHFNSNQGYLDTALFHIRKGRLRQAGSVFTSAARGLCAMSYEESLAWRVEKAPGSPYGDVTATVTLTRGPGREEADTCPGRPRPRASQTYSQTWRWDAAADRYRPAGDGLRRLNSFHANRL